MGFKIFFEKDIILHSIAREVIRKHDLNYISWLCLSITCFHSACQGPEGTTSPHRPCPVSPGSSPQAQWPGAWWPVLGSPWLAWPPAAASPHGAPAPCLWHPSFLEAGLQTGSGCLWGANRAKVSASREKWEPSRTRINGVLPLTSTDLGFHPGF